MYSVSTNIMSEVMQKKLFVLISISLKLHKNWRTEQGCRNVFGSGGGGVPTRPNCKLFTYQLVLVAAAPVLQDFHTDEKRGGGGGGGHGPLAPRFLRPCC